MSIRKFLLVSVAATFAIAAGAHEFWLLPKKYHYKVGEEMNVDFMVGENFTGEFWDLKRHRAEEVQVVSAYGKKSLISVVKPTAGNNLAYKFTNEGTHLFSLVSNTAYIELDAPKFNEYLQEDGLENISFLRKKNNQTDQRARENYTRYAKLLVQSGTVTDEVYKRKLGLKVEIIPLSNPYTLKTGDYLECEIQFEGKSLPHQLVKIWNYVGNRVFLQNAYTENDGRIKFPISASGPWMVSFVKMMPSQKENIDYESSWASLVFGIE